MSKRTILLAVAVVIALIATIFSAFTDAKGKKVVEDPDPDPDIELDVKPVIEKVGKIPDESGNTEIKT
jgi:hypothetical protein